MKIQTLIISILILLSSCVSIKPANTFSKAENRIIQLNKGIQNQIERYPSLVDKAYTTVIIDSIYIKEESAEFTAKLLEVDSLLNVITEYNGWISGRDELIDSLMNIPLNEFPKECQDIVNTLTNRNKTLLKELQIRNKELTKVFTQYQEELTKRITGTYEDDVFLVNYDYYKGEITINPTVKPKWELFEKSIVTNDISIRKNFWQDIKFYIFLTALLLAFYKFNNLFYNIIDSIFTGIKHFIKKIFTKF